jgi:hypothetical protein
VSTIRGEVQVAPFAPDTTNANNLDDGEVSHLPVDTLLDVILLSFNGEPDRTVEELCEAVAPFVTRRQRLAAFDDWIARHPEAAKLFTTKEKRAARGLMEVLLDVLLPFREGGAVTIRASSDPQQGGSVKLAPDKSDALRQRWNDLKDDRDSALQAGEELLADGRPYEAVVLQACVSQVVTDRWDDDTRAAIVDDALDRIAASPAYVTEEEPELTVRLRTGGPAVRDPQGEKATEGREEQPPPDQLSRATVPKTACPNRSLIKEFNHEDRRQRISGRDPETGPRTTTSGRAHGPAGLAAPPRRGHALHEAVSVRIPHDECAGTSRRSAGGHPEQAAKAKGDRDRQRRQARAEIVAGLIERLTRQGLCRVSISGNQRTVRLLSEADPKLRATTRAMWAAFVNAVRAALRSLAGGRQHSVAELENLIRRQVAGPWHERARDLICRDALAAVAELTGYATEVEGDHVLIRLPEAKVPVSGAPAGPPRVHRRLTAEQAYLMNAVLLAFGYRRTRTVPHLCASMRHHLRSSPGVAAYRHWLKTHPCAVARCPTDGEREYWARLGPVKEAVPNLKRRGDVTESYKEAGPPVLLTLTRSTEIVERFCGLHRLASLAHAAADALARGSRRTDEELRAAMRAALPARKGAAAVEAVITHVLRQLEMSGKYATEDNGSGRVFWLQDAPAAAGGRRARGAV